MRDGRRAGGDVLEGLIQSPAKPAAAVADYQEVAAVAAMPPLELLLLVGQEVLVHTHSNTHTPQDPVPQVDLMVPMVDLRMETLAAVKEEQLLSLIVEPEFQ
jgi:hypothetical protein